MPPAASDSERVSQATRFLRARALELCRAGDPVRASTLLRFGAPCDPAMAKAYATSFAPGRGAPGLTPAEPPFLAALAIADLPVEDLRRRCAGKRVLQVYRRAAASLGPRRMEVSWALYAGARRFGLDVQTFGFEPFVSGPDPTVLPSALLQQIIDFRPDVIVYDSAFAEGVPRLPELPTQILAVFAMVRAQLGVRVVLSHTDAWLQLQQGPDRLFDGLGTAFDLVTHCHPAALGLGTPAQQAATWCYLLPGEVVPARAAPGAIGRACFAGSIATYNVSRLAWWAESGRRGLPLDVIETLHGGTMLSDQEYVDLFVGYQLSVNFSQRSGGPKIVTGRTIDVLLCGGVLVEETSVDVEFFLTPWVHYVPFETIDDLAMLLPALLADPARRAALSDAGRTWAQRYFTGDYFWAGLFDRLPAA